MDNGRFVARLSDPLLQTPSGIAADVCTSRQQMKAYFPVESLTADTAGSAGNAGSTGIAQPLAGVPWDMKQQMTQLAILMLCDLGTLRGHAFKVQE
jgi:hypothetical protein